MLSASPRGGLYIGRRFSFAALVACIVVLCAFVLTPFIAPVAWAALTAYITWPMFSRVRRACGRFVSLAALAMTLIVLAIVIVPLAWILLLVQQELVEAYRTLGPSIAQSAIQLPAWLAQLDPFGPWLQGILDQHSSNPALLRAELLQGLQRFSGDFARLLANAGRNAGKLLITALTLFFLYRDGDELVRQIRVAGRRIFGGRLHRSVIAAGAMAHAAVYGLLITGLLQGLLAGVGYALAGVVAPALLGVLTGLASTAPTIGTALVWVPVSVALMLDGHVGRGVFLFLWGFVLVHPIDNIVRPFLISNMTRVPFLLTMFGALGGLSAFGLIGVFAGPILLAVALGFWNDLVREPA